IRRPACYHRVLPVRRTRGLSMPWAVTYTQDLDPIHHLRPTLPNSALVSTFFAAVPVLLLFYLLVRRRWLASKAGAAGALAAILIGFPCGAFLEGAAGGGTPVASCGAMLIGLGFRPFTAAVICLIANTSPVAYGGLGTPILTLNVVTGLSDRNLSAMAGHQLPL